MTSESPEKLSGGGQTTTVGAGAGSGSEEGGEKGTSTVNPSSVSPSSSQFQRLKVTPPYTTVRLFNFAFLTLDTGGRCTVLSRSGQATVWFTASGLQ